MLGVKLILLGKGGGGGGGGGAFTNHTIAQYKCGNPEEHG